MFPETSTGMQEKKVKLYPRFMAVIYVFTFKVMTFIYSHKDAGRCATFSYLQLHSVMEATRRCTGANRLSREEGSWSTQDLCYHQFIMKVFKLIEGLTQHKLADNDMAPHSRLIGRERAQLWSCAANGGCKLTQVQQEIWGLKINWIKSHISSKCCDRSCTGSC